jgi:ABC-type phosphate transport system permease subunit
VDSLPLTLYKYSQLPYPERVAQAWGAAFVLIMLVLLFNIFTRFFVILRVSKMKR